MLTQMLSNKQPPGTALLHAHPQTITASPKIITPVMTVQPQITCHTQQIQRLQGGQWSHTWWVGGDKVDVEMARNQESGSRSEETRGFCAVQCDQRDNLKKKKKEQSGQSGASGSGGKDE